MKKRIALLTILLAAIITITGAFNNSEANESNLSGIHVRLNGTGGTNATVIGTCGGNTYVFTHIEDNLYSLSPGSGYPINQSMQICACSVSSTGASTTITTDYSYSLKMTLTSGCPTGCAGS